MPGTYAQIFFDVVFSTQHRRALITPKIQPRLYAYIGVWHAQAKRGHVLRYDFRELARDSRLQARWAILRQCNGWGHDDETDKGAFYLFCLVMVAPSV